MTIPHKKGGAAQEGGVKSNKGVWGGEVSSVGTPTGQRGCVPPWLLLPLTIPLMMTEYPATHKQQAAFKDQCEEEEAECVKEPQSDTRVQTGQPGCVYAIKGLMEQSGEIWGEFHKNEKKVGRSLKSYVPRQRCAWFSRKAAIYIATYNLRNAVVIYSCLQLHTASTHTRARTHTHTHTHPSQSLLYH